MLASGEEIVGGVTLSNIVRLHLCSANLGYWVDAAQAGRGLASAATLLACRAADTELGLHRLEAARPPPTSPRSGCWRSAASNGSARPAACSSSTAPGATTCCSRSSSTTARCRPTEAQRLRPNA
ncbi:GNAT family N-acetyltransferase [Kitasatospora arboriphila]